MSHGFLTTNTMDFNEHFKEFIEEEKEGVLINHALVLNYLGFMIENSLKDRPGFLIEKINWTPENTTVLTSLPMWENEVIGQTINFLISLTQKK